MGGGRSWSGLVGTAAIVAFTALGLMLGAAAGVLASWLLAGIGR